MTKKCFFFTKGLLNYTKGTIYSKAQCKSTEKEFLSTLEHQGVVEVDQVKKMVDRRLKVYHDL